MLMNFHFLVSTSLYSKFGYKWPMITDKQVQVSCVNDLGPRSRNDIDLQYLHIFINPISFRSHAAIVSEKYVKVSS